MKFIDKYPELFQFFGGYFPDADLMHLSDEEVIAEYISIASKEKLYELRESIQSLILDIAEYWKEVRLEANRYFKSSEDAVKWLEIVKTEIEKGIERK